MDGRTAEEVDREAAQRRRARRLGILLGLTVVVIVAGSFAFVLWNNR